jgi:hypothetical protein
VLPGRRPGDTHLIGNSDTSARRLTVVANAQCVVLSTLGGTGTKTIRLRRLPGIPQAGEQQGDAYRAEHRGTAVLADAVQHGTVIKFEEQFLP